MIEERRGDIFEQADLTHIAHQVNLFHTFGSGIAKEIKERFPYAYEADCATRHGDRQKLGLYKMAYHKDDIWNWVPGFKPVTTKFPVIINVYSQDGIGGQDRQTNYAAMGAALLQLERELQAMASMGNASKLGIPHNIGCGLANGEWTVVRPIIESAFAKSPITVVVCRKPGDFDCKTCGRDMTSYHGCPLHGNPDAF